MLGFAFPGLSGRVNDGAMGIKKWATYVHNEPCTGIFPHTHKNRAEIDRDRSSWPHANFATAFSLSLVARPRFHPCGVTVALFVSFFQFYRHEKNRIIAWPNLPPASLILEKHAFRVVFPF